MLAYVFWHRPRADVSTTEYEVRLRAFHDLLDVPSASFRLGELPFAPDSGYEDWYIVDAWSELGELNANAVAGEHRERHAAIAELAGEGWGGVYARRGAARRSRRPRHAGLASQPGWTTRRSWARLPRLPSGSASSCLGLTRNSASSKASRRSGHAYRKAPESRSNTPADDRFGQPLQS